MIVDPVDALKKTKATAVPVVVKYQEASHVGNETLWYTA